MTNLAFSTTKQIIPTSYEAVAMAASKIGMVTVAGIWIATTCGPNIQAYSKFGDTSKQIEIPKPSEAVGVHIVAAEPSDAGTDFAELFAEATAGVPDEDWNNLPADFSGNFRKYMYGDLA